MLNRKAVLFVALVVLMVVGGCDAVPAPLLSEASPSPTAVRNVLATRQIAPPSPILPTVSAQPAPTLTITVTTAQSGTTLIPPTTVPTVPPTDGFCCLQFAAGPFGQATDTFPAGTEIIYAVWDYSALSPGDRIRRIWLRDDLIWLPREEKWDWEKYGATGTVRDLSIFDFEGTGLQPATYRLQLYLNDTLQQESSFVILSP